MTYSGRLGPEPPDGGSDERDYVALPNSALFDSVDLAQQPDEVLDAILREIARAPGATPLGTRRADRDRPQDRRAPRGGEL